MRQEFRGNAESVAVALRNSMAEVKRVPVNHDGGKEVQARYAQVLAFGGAVADFALTADAQGLSASRRFDDRRVRTSASITRFHTVWEVLRTAARPRP